MSEDITYNELRTFIEQQIKLLQKPVVRDKRINYIIKNQIHLSETEHNFAPNITTGGGASSLNTRRNNKRSNKSDTNDNIAGTDNEDFEDTNNYEDSIDNISDTDSDKGPKQPVAELTTKQVDKLVKLINQNLTKTYRKFYLKQSIHQVTLQIIDNESNKNIIRLNNLLKLNDILTCFEIPNLNGTVLNPIDISGTSLSSDTDNNNNHDSFLEESVESNVNFHGLVKFNKDEILEYIDELPPPQLLRVTENNGENDDDNGENQILDENSLDQNDIFKKENLQIYETQRNTLIENKNRLVYLQEKLQHYKKIKESIIKNLFGTSEINYDESVNLIKSNFLSNSKDNNNDLKNEIVKTSELIDTLTEKLENKTVLENLKKKIVRNFREDIGDDLF
ncbi:hypothetical protein BVG19_g2227 [[Candida] boidinii]|nr:hypothetical protein BVG19_g2227 [[Candida] boidinii]OWB50698.1 hypothetical protein B5S27_g2250 [[Candida] boidinii]